MTHSVTLAHQVEKFCLQQDYSPSILRAAMTTADNITAQAICEGRKPQTMVGAVVLMVL